MTQGIRINEATLRRRLRDDPTINTDLDLVGKAVADAARANADNNIIQVRTGDLLEGIFYEHGFDERGPFVIVGSSAIHRGFAYPAFLDLNPKFRWLTLAFRAVSGLTHVRRVQ